MSNSRTLVVRAALVTTLFMALIPTTQRAFAAPPAPQVVIHVSANAPAGGDGSGGRPYSDVAVAMDAARSAALGGASVVINIEPGSYPVSTTLRIDFPLHLRGANIPVLDDSGWPTGSVEPGTESLIYGTPSLGTDPVLAIAGTDTTSVSASVTNLSLTALAGNTLLQVQRAQAFAVKDNVLSGPGASGVDVVASSGVISDNYVQGMQACGICLAVGTSDHTADVVVQDNRVVGNVGGGMLLVATDQGLELNGELLLSAQVVHNDLSSNSTAPQGFGLRVMAIKNTRPSTRSAGSVNAVFNDNRIVANRFGVVVDAGFPYRNVSGGCDTRVFSGQFDLSFRGNTLEGSAIAAAVVSTTRYLVSMKLNPAANSLANWQYLHGATISLDDPDLVLGSFRYDHPEFDRFTGGSCTADVVAEPLGNTIIYNGSPMLTGQNLPTPLPGE
jgi:hypothetical protein